MLNVAHVECGQCYPTTVEGEVKIVCDWNQNYHNILESVLEWLSKKESTMNSKNLVEPLEPR
jgi:hypothetical protein